jgi:hypothetical protein
MALDSRPISGVSVFAVVVDGGGFVKAADATTRRCSNGRGNKSQAGRLRVICLAASCSGAKLQIWRYQESFHHFNIFPQNTTRLSAGLRASSLRPVQGL